MNICFNNRERAVAFVDAYLQQAPGNSPLTMTIKRAASGGFCVTDVTEDSPGSQTTQKNFDKLRSILMDAYATGSILTRKIQLGEALDELNRLSR